MPPENIFSAHVALCVGFGNFCVFIFSFMQFERKVVSKDNNKKSNKQDIRSTAQQNADFYKCTLLYLWFGFFPLI